MPQKPPPTAADIAAAMPPAEEAEEQKYVLWLDGLPEDMPDEARDDFAGALVECLGIGYGDASYILDGPFPKMLLANLEKADAELLESRWEKSFEVELSVGEQGILLQKVPSAQEDYLEELRRLKSLLEESEGELFYVSLGRVDKSAQEWVADGISEFLDIDQNVAHDLAEGNGRITPSIVREEVERIVKYLQYRVILYGGAIENIEAGIEKDDGSPFSLRWRSGCMASLKHMEESQDWEKYITEARAEAEAESDEEDGVLCVLLLEDSGLRSRDFAIELYSVVNMALGVAKDYIQRPGSPTVASGLSKANALLLQEYLEEEFGVQLRIERQRLPLAFQVREEYLEKVRKWDKERKG